MSEAAERLLSELQAAAAAAAERAGRPPLGLRAVEPGAGGRWYLCAFEGPAFLCLRAGLEVETDPERVRAAAAAGLVCECADELLDPEALHGLGLAAADLAGRGAPELAGAELSLGRIQAAAARTAAWREAPERALASLVALEEGLALHEGVRTAYAEFTAHTDHLAERQDELTPALLEALRRVDAAAAGARAGEALAARLATLMPGLGEQAEEIAAAGLDPPGAGAPG